jgi:hypothetical protein
LDPDLTVAAACGRGAKPTASAQRRRWAASGGASHRIELGGSASCASGTRM